MNITLERFAYLPEGTLGRILELNIYVLERPWLDNKVRESCIPEGYYDVAPDEEGKYSGYPELQDVPGRTEIIIHAANHVHEILGCLAPGMGFQIAGNTPSVQSSRAALTKVMDSDVTGITITSKRAI